MLRIGYPLSFHAVLMGVSRTPNKDQTIPPVLQTFTSSLKTAEEWAEWALGCKVNVEDKGTAFVRITKLTEVLVADFKLTSVLSLPATTPSKMIGGGRVC